MDSYGEWSRFQAAIALAELGHKGQVRQYINEPYFNHPMRVANKVVMVTGDVEMGTVAALHDLLEDTHVPASRILYQFGPRVLRMVVELTDMYTPKMYPELNRSRRKRLEAARLGKTGAAVQTVKLADLIDNSESIIKYAPKAFVRTYMDEKRYLLGHLMKGHRDLRDEAWKIVDDYFSKDEEGGYERPESQGS